MKTIESLISEGMETMNNLGMDEKIFRFSITGVTNRSVTNTLIKVSFL